MPERAPRTQGAGGFRRRSRSLGRRSRRGRGAVADRLGGRRGSGGGRRLVARGQEREWVDVPVRIRRDPDAEVDVWDRVLALAAGADRADRRALAEGRAAVDRDRAEVDERDRVAVLRSHGDGSPARGNGAGEAHDSCRGRADGRSFVAGDVDAAMLPSGVGILSERRMVVAPAPRRARSRRVRAARRPGTRSGPEAGQPSVFISCLLLSAMSTPRER